MKLLLDMNLSPRWEAFLTGSGFEAIHWSRVGPATAADTEIMRYAREGGFVVLTTDLDFGTILAVTQGEKPSVVQLRSDDLAPETIGRQVANALHQMANELAEGALVSIDSGRTRLRILPLRRDVR